MLQIVPLTSTVPCTWNVLLTVDLAWVYVRPNSIVKLFKYVPTSDPTDFEAISTCFEVLPKTTGSLQADDEHNSNLLTVVL